ncbi:urea transporter [Pelagicoccus sp. NFK12]|uniref:Urea transporter n=1 Tax=Pelagicoccus enzymogenes TaxID=2773457 RepID=A0A927FBC3_9BACT|nr:urea transporter [Pelagicoccus enzymogenes]MBD5781279.1 urea transporter [Pelagicoccus enzymogenes]MDQ8198818.1 hypothetical protein [Pelagicoccus enzymogenes]
MNQEDTILAPNVGWILLIAFGVLWVGLGLYWGRKSKSLDGFMLAGRNVGIAFGSATAMATWVTSNTIMVVPQFGLKMGVWGLLAFTTASFGLFLFAPMASRIRNLMPRGFTSGDFIRLRYGKVAWSVFLGISLFYSMAWLVSMAMAGGIVLEALAGINYKYGMSMILLVCVLYTLVGGLYAVIGTDFIQSVIILVGIIAVAVAALSRIDLGPAYETSVRTQPALFNALLPVALLSLFNNMFFGFGEVFHNNVWWSRAFAIRKKVVAKAFSLAGLLWLPIPLAVGFSALFSNSLGINITDIDMTGPLIAGELLGSAGAVVLFVVIFCSLGSSIDSLLAATSDLLAEDVYKKMFNPEVSDARLRTISTMIIVGLGLVVWLICLPRVGNLMSVLFFAGPFVGSAVWPVVTGLYWSRSNEIGAVLAMVLGSAVGLYAYFEYGWYTASLIATIVSMLITFGAIAFSKTRFQWSKLNEEEL